jgi:hypothetical protein
MLLPMTMDHPDPDQDPSQDIEPTDAESSASPEADEPMFPMPDLDLELREGLHDEEDR